ncbi:MAG: cation-efflux pump [Chloroflexota bacterium]
MNEQDRYSGVRRVLLLTLVGNVVVAGAKLAVGLLTGSLAMVADGFHSTLDGTSNVIGLASSALAARPPDADHPYGHRRFETLASMLVGGVLLLTAWELVKNSVSRLFSPPAPPEVTAISFITMIGTLALNLVVSAYERQQGERLHSEFLLADAGHARSDVFVSLTVLADLVAVKLGVTWVDPAAALIVVGLIAMTAWRIVRHSANILLDQVAIDPEEVIPIVQGVAGVHRVGRVRSRGPADDIHLDLDVRIAGPTTAEQSNAIAREIRTRLRNAFEGLRDIQVYFLPEIDGEPDYALTARAEADSLGLGVHEVIASTREGALTLEMHVEVPHDLTVGKAHAIVTEFEGRLREAIPDLERLVTHIEPAHTHEDAPLYKQEAHIIALAALRIAQRLYPDKLWHDLDIRAEADGGFAVSMHCHVADDMPLEEAHRLAEQVETRVRATLPEIHRVTIHTEPPGG